jgi:hypothetical protein
MTPRRRWTAISHAIKPDRRALHLAFWRPCVCTFLPRGSLGQGRNAQAGALEVGDCSAQITPRQLTGPAKRQDSHELRAGAKKKTRSPQHTLGAPHPRAARMRVLGGLDASCGLLDRRPRGENGFCPSCVASGIPSEVRLGLLVLLHSTGTCSSAGSCTDECESSLSVLPA